MVKISDHSRGLYLNDFSFIILMKPVFPILIGFNADPDPAFKVNVRVDPDADPEPDPGFW